MKKKSSTFILTLALWVVFVGHISVQVVLLGTVICSIITFMFADHVLGLIKMKYIFLLVSGFIYDVFLSAIRVSRHTFQIEPSFSPRIVRVKTSHEKINSIAILANFITLTQGTLVMDFDISNRNYLIHCIDVHGDDEVEAKKARIHKHEDLIDKISGE